jgi:hypothetical protein
MNSPVRTFALLLLAASACLFALAGPVDLRQRAEERTRAAPDLDARFTSAKG